MTLIVNFDSMLTSQGPFIKYLAVAMPFASFTAIGFLVVKIEELENRTLRKICISSTAIGTSVFITCQLLFGIGPKYTHQHIEYPAGSFYILKIDSQYRQMAQWVEDGNGVYTNSLIKGRTLKSLLGHFVNLNVISLNKVPNHGYLICLSELDLDSLKQIKDYNFSVSDFYSLPIKEWPPRKDQSSS